MSKKDKFSTKQRIEFLCKFTSNIREWYSDDLSEEFKEAFRVKINRDLIAVRTAMHEAGISDTMVIDPPPAVGGYRQTFSMLDNVFRNFWGVSCIPSLIDKLEQTIGVYQHVQNGDNLLPVKIKETIDIENAIERALRPSFGKITPNNEREVQDHIETILNALGVEFTREKDSTSVGVKSYRPDFVLQSLDLALEVKYARKGHEAAKIQEELNADISAYKTKWTRMLIVIYDDGVISDPQRFQESNQKLFGVSIVIIKH